MHTKERVLNTIVSCGLIPVIRTKNSVQAVRVADAIQKGGAPLLEITMTVPGALDVLKKITETASENVIVGAGTVLDGETARMAILAGAEFVLSPSLNPEMIRVCRRYGKVAIPGAMTPTEVLTAWELGADFVKVFPADVLGGADYIKALKGPLPQIQLIPTGGVHLDNASSLIKAGAAALGVGGSLVDGNAASVEEFEGLTRKTEKFLEVIQNARLS